MLSPDESMGEGDESGMAPPPPGFQLGMPLLLSELPSATDAGPAAAAAASPPASTEEDDAALAGTAPDATGEPAPATPPPQDADNGSAPVASTPPTLQLSASSSPERPAAAAAGDGASPALASPPPAAPTPAGSIPMFNPASMGGSRSGPAIPAVPTLPPLPTPSAPPGLLAQSTGSPASAGGAAPPREPLPPLTAQWFFQHASGGWTPFCRLDSAALEEAYALGAGEEDSDEPGQEVVVVATDGNRCDVQLAARTRTSAYNAHPPNAVRRGTWYAGTEDDFVPFPEDDAARLEEAFVGGWETGKWHIRIELDSGDLVVLRNESLFVLYPQGVNATETPMPRSVKRGYTEPVDEGEPVDRPIDHVVLVVPGAVPEQPQLAKLGYKGAGNRTGNVTDLVDSMRFLAREMMSQHFQLSETSKSSGRVELLPVVWTHAFDGDRDVHKDAAEVRLPRVAALRKFTNDVVLEIIASTTGKQDAVNNVVARMNAVIATFLERNANFEGQIHVFGHGLGGCLVFDILAHQKEALEGGVAAAAAAVGASGSAGEADANADDADTDVEEEAPSAADAANGEPAPSLQSILESAGLEKHLESLVKEDLDFETLATCSAEDLKDLGISVGHRKKILTAVQGHAEEQQKAAAAAAKRREQEQAERVARRNERRMERRKHAAERAEKAAAAARAALAADQAAAAAVQYGVVQFKVEKLFLAGCPLGLLTAVRPVAERKLSPEFRLPFCQHVYNLFHPNDPLAFRLEPIVQPAMPKDLPAEEIPHHQGRKRMHLELSGYLKTASSDLKREVSSWAGSAWKAFRSRLGGQESTDSDAQDKSSQLVPSVDRVPESEAAPTFGALNGGLRVDYVLQEDPLDLINEQLFSLRSHNCYWTSEDTVLFALTRLYTAERPAGTDALSS